MRFYTQQHKFYCGIDLHARSMYLCILDQDGNILFHKNILAQPDPLLEKVKNDRIDSRKIAGLLRAGMIPQAYVYPAGIRAARDLLRRRNYLNRN